MKHFLTLPLLFLAFGLSAQYFEAGLFSGVANYRGDLNGGKLSHENYSPALGMFARYNVSERLAFRANLYHGTVTGADQYRNVERGLNFRSEVLEFGLNTEFNLGKFHIPAKEISAPYLFAGVALFHFNPQAEYRGELIDLQPLGTEGQNMEGDYETPYKLWQVSVPMGVGFKFNINPRINFGIELGIRKTFTDYLDDVSTNYPDIYALRDADPMAAALSFRSPEVTGEPLTNPIGTQRGNAATKDDYYFAGVSVSINLTDKYGLDFDERYDVFKEDFQRYLENRKPKPSQYQQRKRARKQRSKLQRKKRAEIRKKKRAWKKMKQNKETMEGANPNPIHKTN